MSIGQALVLTISDSAFAGRRNDLSGPEAKRILEEAGFDVAAEIHSQLRVRTGNTLTGTAKFIRDRVKNAVLFTQRNAELQAELERVLAKRVRYGAVTMD